jgi:fumarylacetoacetate (FAA) hydrolase
MKLATIRNGTRDGTAVLVSRNMKVAVRVGDIVSGLTTLQQILDDWERQAPALERAAAELEQVAEGAPASLPIMPFDPTQCMAPLPRAFQWADGSAYVNHVELVRRARGAELPASFWTDPLMYQGGSDTFLGPRDPIPCRDPDMGLDLEGEIGAITGDVPMASSPESALARVRLLVLINDVSLRNVIPGELAKGFGFFHGKPSSAFAPCAVTPDELSTAWQGGKLHLPLQAWVNGRLIGRPNAGIDMTFAFGTLIAHAARTRHLGAGTIIGSGTVSNKLDGGPGRSIEDGGAGYTCLAEVRTVETLLDGKPRTPFLAVGDRVRLEVCDAAGQSVFGAIEQSVVRYDG